MSMPSLPRIFSFVFRYDEFLEELRVEWESRQFVSTLDYIAGVHDISDIPAVEKYRRQAVSIVRAGNQGRIYQGLEVDNLYSEHAVARFINVLGDYRGRVIPIVELYDWLIRVSGSTVKVVVDSKGLVASTNLGYVVKIPGCKIYTGNTSKDAEAYENACDFIAHVTDGDICLDAGELSIRTDSITAELRSDRWSIEVCTATKRRI